MGRVKDYLLDGGAYVAAGALAYWWPDKVGSRSRVAALLSLHRVTGYYTHVLWVGAAGLGVVSSWFVRLNPAPWATTVGLCACGVLAVLGFVQQDLGGYSRALGALRRA